MNHIEAGRYWNDNAEAWTAIARAGFDIYRDYLNTPAFFEMLPDVKDLQGLDIGCGEGYNTRLLAQKGAIMSAVDISEVFIEKAKEARVHTSININYIVASAVDLPFRNGEFDFATSFMCLMDIPEMEKALAEAFRIIKPGGFLQFSISHPCFDTPFRRNKRDSNGQTYAIEVGGYFNAIHGHVDEWIFGAAPSHLKAAYPKFKTPKFSHTLSQWVNALVQTGFLMEQMNEPRPSDDVILEQPRLHDCQQVAYFLHVRCRKPFK